MEEFPPLGSQRRISLNISLYPFLFDHRTQAGAVLPAVQTMQILASAVQDLFPVFQPRTIFQVSFGKLLLLSETADQLRASCELVSLENNRLGVKLLTRNRTRSGIVRHLLHASLEFCSLLSDNPPVSDQIKGDCEGRIPVSEVYPGLVSFGSHFQNLLEPIEIYKNGAITCVGGGNPVPGPKLLGSPFPLDAAFHAACAWGRHYVGKICYPVAINNRTIYQATQPQKKYDTVVIFKGRQGDTLEFDLFLKNAAGVLCETVTGLLMKEIGNGKSGRPG